MLFSISLLTILFLFILSIYFNIDINAESPKFVRQEVDDSPYDLMDYSNKILSHEEINKCKKDNFPPIDIQGVSYVSDQKFLNVTVWLDDNFKSFINSNSIFSEISFQDEHPNLLYQMLL